MKLELQQKFSLEIPTSGEDEIITGTIAPISKQQKKDNEKAFDNERKLSKDLQKKSTKLRRLALKVEKAERDETTKESNLTKLYKDIDALSDEVETQTEELLELDITEKVAKSRFDLSVKSEQLDRLKEICELVGYSKVIETIHKEVQEGKPKDSVN